MAKTCNWLVHYIWETNEVYVGEHRTKEIDIVDDSKGRLTSFASGVFLIVSSANKESWHDLAQQ